jgi:hypothetical protein
VKTNIDKSSPNNEYTYSSYQIKHEHVNRDSKVSLFDIQLYVDKSQKLSNKEKI